MEKFREGAPGVGKAAMLSRIIRIGFSEIGAAESRTLLCVCEGKMHFSRKAQGNHSEM